MSFFDEYIEGLLPGNYALTKSMELTKKSSSGTLWYTKKYLVLYYYVFLSNEIMTDEYINKVTDYFDSYISSIDESIRDSAIEFFYPEDDSRNFKSKEFKSFMSLANKVNFANSEEKARYYNNAKKCYFSILMGTGGQAGVKEKVVSSVKKQNFNYSQQNIYTIIKESVAEICAEKANSKEDFYNGDIPRILSREARDRIIETAKSCHISKDDIINIMNTYPCSEEYPATYGQNNNLTIPQFSGIENDCFASIRNERQILYYYGYFHSKSTGASDFEFSSLTPVGELALKANSFEFLAIWEHQKLKMISQPATAEINNIPQNVKHPELFSISYTPYTNILGYILRNDSITIDEYKYIVSRQSSKIDSYTWEENEKILKDKINIIQTQVANYKRQSDIKSDDGRKELLKYILGIRSDLIKDNKTNPLNIVKYTGSKVLIEEKDSINTIYSIYRRIDDYKIEKYLSVFDESEKELRNKYVSSVNNSSYVSNPLTKVHWDLYNIHIDKFIVLSVIIATACVKYNYDIDYLSKDELDNIVQFSCTYYQKILKCFRLEKEKRLKNEIRNTVNCLRTEDYSPYIEESVENRFNSIAEYKQTSATDLFEKIERVSSLSSISDSEERTRNNSLTGLLKTYYILSFANESGYLTCECCGNETFITNTGEPYLEFHHLIPFNIAYGPDHYLNLFALCPNCHRKIHYLSVTNKENEYHKLSSSNYLQLTFVDRLKKLKENRLLRSYHLEYLLADKAISIEEYNSIAA